MVKKNKYADWSKEELIKRIESLEKRKKYGLVWDEERTKEKFEADAEGKLPVLKEVKSKEIKTDPDKPTHILIEGDNFHALSVLNYTHEKAIDAIYIDPPYNTGAKDWIYNNRYVDASDAFRHSKWLSFMDKRLRLSKNLLKKDGIICCTIDDYELPRLFILMEEIFGEENHLGTIPIRNNPAGRSSVKGISVTHEYALFFGRSSLSKVGRLLRSERQKNRYDEKDELGSFEWVNFRKPGSLKEESPKMFYPIFVSNNSFRLPEMKWSQKKQEYDLFEKPRRNEIILYPTDDDGKERRWRWGTDRFLRSSKEFVVKSQKDKLQLYVKGRVSDEEGILPMTWWDNRLYSSTAYGTNLLKEIFSDLQVFAYPKSIYAVIDCIKVLTNKKDVIILDFFAGSGTTGHAVLELNKMDNGTRQFILCTNNENNIMTDVCHPRIEKVMRGYTSLSKQKVEGLVGNLKYYKNFFVPSQPTDRNKEILTKEAVEMLCLRENTFDLVSENGAIKIYRNKDRYTGIIFDQLAIPKFKKAASKFDKPISVYVFSLGDDDFAEEFADMKTIKVCSIPEAILRVYRRIFQ